jgi:PAP2 superfamily C-terminal
MKEIFITYKESLKEKRYIKSLVSSVLLLIVSGVFSFYAGTYATLRESSSVTDIILSNTRAIDVDGLFIYGGLIFFVGVLVLTIAQPKRLPFTFKSIALFFIIRSLFISATHIGPFPDHTLIHPGNLVHLISFDGDLFFSGHTGLPFLLALIYWDTRIYRYIFLLLSLFFGVIVLLGHLHYTIDVLAAFFITYTISDIARYLFPSDFKFASSHT